MSSEDDLEYEDDEDELCEEELAEIQAMDDLCQRHGLPKLIDIDRTVGKTIKRVFDRYPLGYIQFTDDTITWFDWENLYDYKPEHETFFRDLMKNGLFPAAKKALAESREEKERQAQELELKVAKQRYEELLSRQRKCRRET